MKFVPAIFTDSVEGLKRQLDILSPYFDHFSIDIDDGHFENNHTYQIQDLVYSKDKWIENNFDKIAFDFDLMVTDWETSVNKLDDLANHILIQNVFLHAQTLNNYHYPIDNNYNFAIGLAIDPKDEYEDLASHINLDHINAIQIMTIYSGSQGQSIIPNLLNKIGILRAHHYSGKIYIDGGVNEETLQVILSQQELPDFVCVGSYLSQAGNDLQRRITYLKSIEIQTTAKEV